MGIKDLLSPFKAWKNVLQNPITIRKPLEREGAPRYRGFHQNDMDKCIGCGTCEEICMNAAIDMMPVEGQETVEGDSGLRPKIDYGRCCWCGLCVDICTTCSLTMSNKFQWIERDPDNFRFIPGFDKKYWDDEPLGYCKHVDYNINKLERVHMGELHPEERIDSFIEMIKGYSTEQAQKEADRCVECGICTATCPAHMGIPQYIKAIREGDIEEGLRILYETNPLPEICGRICTHKCETVCALNHKGEPLSIRWLKRYIADQIPSDKYKEILSTENIEQNDKKIAIVGAGPAGLSAAYYLALLGYKVKIYESLPEAGGMTRYGIPEYRLPYDQIDKDVNYIKDLGVEFQFNTRIGEKITLEQLHEQYDAVFAGTGLHLGRSTRVDGADHKRVYMSIDMLREFTMGNEIDVAESIVVVGGGNVAMDITRTLARLQKQKYGKVCITTTCLETEETMPADLEEITEAREEGATLDPGWGPKSIEIVDDKIKGLHVVKCLAIFDDEGRFNPKFDNENKKFFEGEMIVESIGQGMDISYTDGVKDQITFTNRGRIEVNKDFQSSLPWLFVGGDIIQGPDVISGIANGHKAAKGIDEYLVNLKKK
jgi:glutamate synthase (NADPH) small chain